VQTVAILTMPAGVGKASSVSGQRIVVLDGLRGMATILVVISHYFGEVPHGLRAVMLGWIAVDMFFVLSGFLIGKLILERRHHANFFMVFYVRRFCRILPAYLAMLVVTVAIMHCFPRAWMEAGQPFPLWSYLSFTQVFFMSGTQSLGTHWLAPTWTLAVEEHFYLLAPALLVFTPRRWLVPALVPVAALAVLLRLVLCISHSNPVAALVLLPARADILVCGMLAAVATRSPNLDWGSMMPALRVVPVLALGVVVALRLVQGEHTWGILAPLLVAAGCATYMLGIIFGAPEAKRYHSKALQFFGNNGLCIYLIHLPVLGLMHGVILRQAPDIATPAQWLVTLAAVPACVGVSFIMTKLIEEPIAAFGRSWRWSVRLREMPPLACGLRQAPYPAGVQAYL